MENSCKVLIIIVISVILCSLVWLYHTGQYSLADEEKASISEEEAVSLADRFLIHTLGSEFFYNHFTFKKIDKTPYLPLKHPSWLVIYEYTYTEYTVDTYIVIDVRPAHQICSRVNVRSSRVILEPQKILILTDEAKAIAQEHEFGPPYDKVYLTCDSEHHRICWVLKRSQRGILIDAETGTVFSHWLP